MKNTNENADTAPPAAPDTISGAEPPEVLGWPFIERRKADRRASDRRRSASQPDPLRTPESGVCTDRELQIVRLLTQGMTNKQIANKLGIAEDTVKKHLQHVYKKLGVRRRALLIIDRVAPKRPRRNPS
ncbi:MAG TPA: helix-turn-helix transcriptional regulator [Steroidobacteraceae bacterium]|nr:helix-turn-helix transcriptional regulator [Steroidobacteraceae bacterium]